MAEPFKRLEARFTGERGSDSSLEAARAAGFVPGEWYVVQSLEVGTCSSYLSVFGKARQWNTIMFDLEVKTYKDPYAGTVWEGPPSDSDAGEASIQNDIDWARAIVRHYSHSRGAGSTFLQRHGWLSRYAGPHKKLVLLPRYSSPYDVTEAEALESGCTCLFLSDPEALVGRRGPLVVEHSVLTHILSSLLAALERATASGSERDAAVRELVDTLEQREADSRRTRVRLIEAVGRVRARFGLRPGKAKVAP